MPPEKHVELRELEPMLREKLGRELRVLDYSTESLLPVGENYGSSIAKVDAVVRRHAAAEAEELHLVAKMLPATEFQRQVFDSPFTFKKEIFFYEELLPSYRRLERELGVEEAEVIDIVPEFYGARLSLLPGADVDDDAVILVENLKIKGYYTGDRREGLDLEHMRTAALSLAHFHALGFAMRQHRPDYFEVLKDHAKCLTMSKDISFESLHNFLLRSMREDPTMATFYERIEFAMQQELATKWSSPPPEGWGTIVHMDFWVNNIMYRKDDARRIVDVKYVDFQNYLHMSPLRELIFFIGSNATDEVAKSHVDELIDIYYERFIEMLKRLHCDTSPFSRDRFDERLKKDALVEFLHCAFMIKVMTNSPKADATANDVKELMMTGKENPLLVERLRRCVLLYAEKGWF